MTPIESVLRWSVLPIGAASCRFSDCPKDLELQLLGAGIEDSRVWSAGVKSVARNCDRNLDIICWRLRQHYSPSCHHHFKVHPGARRPHRFDKVRVLSMFSFLLNVPAFSLNLKVELYIIIIH